MARTYRLGPARRAVNSIMTVLLKAGVGPRSTYLMTTRGRRSGRLRTTPVTLVEHGTDRWLVAPYGTVSWVHNVRANPTVELRRGRQRRRLRAEEVAAAIAGPVLHRYVRAVAVTRPYFDAGPDDPDTAFVDEAAKHPVFRLSEARGAP
ncbi:nitroreductase family deazaflavin-dependent oxidoreductase [Mycobacterium sp.]|uniref:nitroreductase family deazaflavin-dependent oxidoreductase n=1 Tax=Mycobacterium sp. TaxID=1785 RepID=UPI00127BFBA6|nr:nitroreductase family deazaflavin-dependent oxidoreductase [Mycobacterium sp.]KAA8966911.1 MAG: nitroreductase family deazaflavin-dependent oxidoreductase [Mycobacterium sp.]